MIYCGLIGGWAAQIFFQSLKKRFMMQMHKRDVFSKTNQPKNRKATGPNSLIYLKKTHTTLSKKKTLKLVMCATKEIFLLFSYPGMSSLRRL